MPAIDALFDELVNRGGSDLHLGANQLPLARVRGDLVPLRDVPIPEKQLEEMLMELVSASQRARLAAERHVELSVAHRDVARFRASVFSKHTGLAAAFRLVPARVPSLAEVNAPEVAWKLADRTRGLVLVAGPASSGKTTTMAAMVDHINKTRACQIVTIEDPIEVVHEPLRAQVAQREVGGHTPSVAAGLANAARENADVVVVSELRTIEEIELALRLAGDGMLVLSTYQASGAVAALDRMLASSPPDSRRRLRAQLASSLNGVVVQHLVRAADSKSRVAAHEVLIVTATVAMMLREGNNDGLVAAMASGSAASMQALDDVLERLVNAGKITPDAALARAIDKEAFARVAGKAGFVDVPS